MDATHTPHGGTMTRERPIILSRLSLGELQVRAEEWEATIATCGPTEAAMLRRHLAEIRAEIAERIAA